MVRFSTTSPWQSFNKTCWLDMLFSNRFKRGFVVFEPLLFFDPRVLAILHKVRHFPSESGCYVLYSFPSVRLSFWYTPTAHFKISETSSFSALSSSPNRIAHIGKNPTLLTVSFVEKGSPQLLELVQDFVFDFSQYFTSDGTVDDITVSPVRAANYKFLNRKTINRK